MKRAEEHRLNLDSIQLQLDEGAKKVIELFYQLDDRQQERALWMIQGYNLAQQIEKEKKDETL